MRKTMFRWLIVLAILLPCMMLTAFADERTVTASGYCGGEGDGTNLTWTLYEDGEMVISGTGAMAHYNSDSMPWLDVQGNIGSVTIGDSVSTIGSYAFANCWNLTTATFGSGLQHIGQYAFNCVPLTEVVIPAGVTDIGVGAFSGSLNIVITVAPENQNYCTVDGALLTKDMRRLLTYSTGRTDTTYTIPDSVTTVDRFAFFNAVWLKEVTIPAGVTNLGETIFYNCELEQIHLAEENTAFTMVDGALYTADMKRLAAYEAGNSRTTLHIPDGVETIDDGVFRRARLTSLCLPDSVEAWDEKFCYMWSLSSVVIGSGISSIADYDFNGISNPTDIYYIGDEAAWNAVFQGSESDLPYGATVHFVTREQLHTLTAGDGVALSAHCAPAGTEVTVMPDLAQIPAGYRLGGFLVDGTEISGDTFVVAGNHIVTASFVPIPSVPDWSARTPITRREMAVWVVDNFVDPSIQPMATESPFTDVPVTDEGFREIMICYELELMSGYNETVFGPDDSVNRAQLAVLLCNLHCGLKNFDVGAYENMDFYADVAEFGGGWCKGYVNWCIEIGFMTGFDDGFFYPGEAATIEDINATGLRPWWGELCTVDVTDVQNGSVSIDRTYGQNGKTVTVTATPDKGYKLTSILVDGSAIQGNTFTMTGAHTVTVVFEKKVQSTVGYFSIEVIKTIKVDGQNVDICRWVWTPAE